MHSLVEEARNLVFSRDTAENHERAFAQVAGGYHAIQRGEVIVGVSDRWDSDL